MSDQNGSGVEIEDVSFEDSESYVQRRRQKEILDAAKNALETRGAAREELARGEIDAQTCREVLRISVENLISEVEHMLKRVGERSLWEDKQLGDPIYVYPPQEFIGYIRREDVEPIGEVDVSPRQVQVIRGIKGYRDAQSAFSARWDVSVQTRHEGPQDQSFQAQTKMPINVSEAAISEIKGFLSRCGLGIDAKLNDYTGDDGPGL